MKFLYAAVMIVSAWLVGFYFTEVISMEFGVLFAIIFTIVAIIAVIVEKRKK